MRANKHLLLWASLASLLLLGVAAYQENVLQPWRQLQARYAALQAATPGNPAFEVKLRQVVQPALKATDRCISCHVGMAPGEVGVEGDPVFGPHPDVVHDPAEFGCVVCHGGQGRATETFAAHGAVPHWPTPMIPKTYAWAGCGTCHTHVAVPNEAQLARGEALFERYDCLSCHRLGERGGTLRPDGTGGMEGPDLSRAGASGRAEGWYADHLRRHEVASGGLWRAAFGPIPAEARRAISSFLGAQVGAPGLVAAKSLFHSLGCRGCHAIDGVGGDDGPELTTIGQRDPALVDWSPLAAPKDGARHNWADWLREHFRDPAAVVPDSQMPDFALTEAETEALVFYMLSLRRAEAPEAYWPPDRARAVRLHAREFAADGETLFTTFCAACHGATGQGVRFAGTHPFPAVGNADFLAVASDRFLLAALEHGRTGRRMPSWGKGGGGLRPAEAEAIVAHLRAAAGGVPSPAEDEPARWVDPETAPGGQRLYAQLCAGCHGAAGEGPDAPQLAHEAFQADATDRYLVETIRRGRRGTAMGGFGRPSPVRPVLTDGQLESIAAFVRTFARAQETK